MLRTALAERPEIVLPLVQAGLSPAGRPALAAAVSAAGTLGVLSGLGALTPETLRRLECGDRRIYEARIRDDL
jgi:NAD(P)H-dependent flavin oxidoreductase YrpB (nitropropane dioxygenase family)